MTRQTSPSRSTLVAAVAAAVLLAVGSARPTLAAVVPTGFADRLVVGGLDSPVGMAFLPDGRLLVVEQKSARVRLIVADTLAGPDPILTVQDVNVVGNERGLLGIAADPKWKTRPYVYVHCTDGVLGKVRISRYIATGDLSFRGDGHLTLDPLSRYDLLDDVPDAASNHNGGTLRFGPDGMLYVSLGEDASQCNAQDSVSFRGVILRLDVSGLPAGAGGPAAKAQLVPAGNPFVSSADANERLVWAIGLRNPFRFHVDPANGALFIADVGESHWEEIDRAPDGGHNFGWPAYEGTSPFEPCLNAVRGDDPIAEYDRSAAATAAIVSGGVYRRAGVTRAFPVEYEGEYFFSEYYSGILRRLEGSGASWQLASPVPGQPTNSNWGEGFAEVSDYLEGPDGALWYCRQSVNYASHSGAIRRIVSTSGDTMPPPPPLPESLTFEFGAPRPTPAVGSTVLSFTLGHPARVELVVYDIGGRAVRTLVAPGVWSASRHEVTWDGTDGAGQRVTPGLYVARLTVDGRTRERRIPMLR
jgi:glucose/arabinose dehydrogenase